MLHPSLSKRRSKDIYTNKRPFENLELPHSISNHWSFFLRSLMRPEPFQEAFGCLTALHIAAFAGEPVNSSNAVRNTNANEGITTRRRKQSEFDDFPVIPFSIKGNITNNYHHVFVHYA